MDLKKTKIFSIVLFVASILTISIFVALLEFVKYISNSSLELNIKLLPLVPTIQNINIVSTAILGSISIICWISLIVQTSRFDIDFRESMFFMIMALLSIIPICSLLIFLRIISLEKKSRQEKIELLIDEMENNLEFKEEMKEKMNELTSSLSNKSSFFEKSEEPKIESLDLEDDIEKFKTTLEDDKSSDEIENSIDSISIIDTNESDINDAMSNDEKELNEVKSKINLIDSIEENKKDEVKNNTSIKKFDRKKYLSLKGTNYSREKKEGKKVISKNKWLKLNALVDDLEKNKITEKEFNKSKESLLDK